MGYLKNKLTYLCGPIAYVNDCTTWREYVSKKLESYGIIIQDPCKTTIDGVGEIGADKDYFKKLIKNKEYSKVKKEFYKIIRKDLKQVDRADFLIFYHEPKIPTVGSWHEAINCINKKSPLLIVCPQDKIEDINPWLLTLIKPQWLFGSWDEMFSYLDKIDAGNLDSSHWW